MMVDFVVNAVCSVFFIRWAYRALFQCCRLPGASWSWFVRCLPDPRRKSSITVSHVLCFAGTIATFVWYYKDAPLRGTHAFAEFRWQLCQLVYAAEACEETDSRVAPLDPDNPDANKQWEKGQWGVIPWLILVYVGLMVTLGVLSLIISYVHLMIGGFISCWKRLIVMSCGLWTEDTIKEYRILVRAALADADGDGKASAHEAVASITARSHGLCTRVDGSKPWPRRPARG